MSDEFAEDFAAEVDDSVVADGGIVTAGTSSDYDKMWDSLEESRKSQVTLSSTVVDAVKGGLVIDLGVRGFIPKSQIATRDLNDLERYIGQTVQFKISEVDKEKGRVICSERRADDEIRSAQRKELLKSLKPGQLVDGVVRRITEFGAFVDIGGIDGLLHISDISWDHVEKAEDFLQVDQQLQLKVLRVEQDGKRISLGLKQLEDDPWTAAFKQMREGSIIDVTITKLESFGAIAQVMKGVEATIPTREMSERRIETPAEAVAVGQEVTAKIIEFRPRDRRMTLSIKQVARDRERNETREFMQKQKAETIATPTMGDIFGDVFNKLKK